MCALVPEQMAPLKRRQESRPHKILGVGYSLLPGTLFIMAALISGGHFPHSPVGEESACNAGDRFDSWVGKIHWRRDRLPTPVFLGFLCGSAGKESTCNSRFNPWGGKMPWRREQIPTPVFWPEEFHGLFSPWGHKELDTTEQLSLSLSGLS